MAHSIIANRSFLKGLLILIGLVCSVVLIWFGWNFFRSNSLASIVNEGSILPSENILSPIQTSTAMPLFLPTSTAIYLPPTQSIELEKIFSPFELDTTLFKHPKGIFQFYPPLGWSKVSNNGSTTFTSPDSSEHLDIMVTFTNENLNNESFERFVNAREDNLFRQFTLSDHPITEVDRVLNFVQGTSEISKRLVVEGSPYVVTTSYQKGDRVIYTMDFWFRDIHPEFSLDQYSKILLSIGFQGTAPYQPNIFEWVFRFCSTRHNFSFNVPVAWKSNSEERGNSSVYTFTSPDQHAVIQGIAFEDGEPISKSVAGEFALVLLRSYYAQDIWVYDNRILPNGAERVSWYSAEGEYHGISQIFTSNQTLIIVGLLVDDVYQYSYEEVFENVSESISFQGICSENGEHN